MRIAQVAPLFETVPPHGYGGTERVVAYLTDELVRQGHDVTLFASGDSNTLAKLVPCAPRALRTDPECADPFALHVVMAERVYRQADAFDAIHVHIDYLAYSLAHRSPTPTVATLHGRLDLPQLPLVYDEFPDQNVVSISHAQRAPLPWLNWAGTVHHGVPRTLYGLHPGRGGYLAFVGRISPEKRVDRAIEIAERVGMELRIAAKVDKVDRDYYRDRIAPLVSGNPRVSLEPEIDDEAKDDFLGGAYATLFPIDWPEPFGLIMIESMACGTPVIAWPCGSVPEVIVDGVNGFVCSSIPQAVAAVEKVATLDRAECRRDFERRFTAERMTRDYLRIYDGLCRTESDDELAVSDVA
jgi:glycosyltransferase involved in cell wall biosynthesis